MNRFGLQSLSAPVHIPDFHLMIGSAEDLSSKPIIIWEDVMPKQVYQALPNVSGMTYEQVQENLASGKLTINDFFQNTYPLGDPLPEY